MGEEVPLWSAWAGIFYFDEAGNNWSPADSGSSSIAVYHSPVDNFFRIVAIAAGGKFDQVEDAENFNKAVSQAVQTLQGGSAPAPAPAQPSPARPKPVGGAGNDLLAELSSVLKGGGLKKTTSSPSFSSLSSSSSSSSGTSSPSESGRSQTFGSAMSRPAAEQPAQKPSLFGTARLKKPAAPAQQKESAISSPTTPTATSTAPSSLSSSAGRATPTPVAKAMSPRPAASTTSSTPSSASPTITRALPTASAKKPAEKKPVADPLLAPAGGDLGPPPTPSADTASSPSPKASQVTVDLEALKLELLSIFREELERTKVEILEALRS